MSPCLASAASIVGHVADEFSALPAPAAIDLPAEVRRLQPNRGLESVAALPKGIYPWIGLLLGASAAG